MHLDFLLLMNSKNFHVILIKNFDRVMTSKTKHHGEKHFCKYCLQYVFGSKVLECRGKK